MSAAEWTGTGPGGGVVARRGLTPSGVARLPAGDELDALVALVMGWWPDGAGGWHRPDGGDAGSPSADWRAAGQVVERMRLHLWPSEGHGWFAMGLGQGEPYATGETPQLAAARACVLLAMFRELEELRR